MPLPRPPNYYLWAFENARPDPMLWLIEVRSPAGGAVQDMDGQDSIIRLTPNREPVTYGASSSGVPIVWTPWDVTFSAMERRAGEQPTVSLRTGFGSWHVNKLLDRNDRLRNHRVYMHLVPANALDDPHAAVTFPFKVSSVRTRWSGFVFELAPRLLGEFSFPTQRITRDSCQHAYRGSGCLFNGDPGNTLGDCVKTRAACNARGAWEVANGYPELHPQQFKAFAGLTRGAARVQF